MYSVVQTLPIWSCWNLVKMSGLDSFHTWKFITINFCYCMIAEIIKTVFMVTLVILKQDSLGWRLCLNSRLCHEFASAAAEHRVHVDQSRKYYVNSAIVFEFSGQTILIIVLPALHVLLWMLCICKDTCIAAINFDNLKSTTTKA